MPTLRHYPRNQRVVGLSGQFPRSSGSVELGKKRGFTMRIWIAMGMLMATTVAAYADLRPVPEIDAFSGLAAMGVVGSIAALIWERRRGK